MRKFKHLTFAIGLILLSQNLFSQTQDSLYFLNILTPFNQSIPSSEIGGAIFGASIDGPIYGELTYASDIEGENWACDTIPNDLSGKVALVDRGVCFFNEKAFKVEQEGAIACIICNFEDPAVNMAEGDPMLEINIPTIMLSLSQCENLRNALDAGEVVELGLDLKPALASKVTGKIAHDENLNCALDIEENPLNEFKVTATRGNNTYSTFSNAQGEYCLFLDTGNYVVQVIPPSDIWINCADPVDIMFPDFDLEEIVDFSMESTIDCPILSVDIASPFLRRCFENYFRVEYCNLGSEVAENAFVTIMFDSLFTITSSSIPYTQDGNIYTFDLGDLDYGACDVFNIVADLSCDADLGMTFCSIANIFPNSSCVPSSPSWDGVDIQVSGSCDEPNVLFEIRNNGTDMTDLLEYKVIRNAQFLENGTFRLNSEETQILSFPADGATYRVEAKQSADHPWANLPSATIEACSSNGDFETGFHAMFPVADFGETYDELCQVVVGSFDPNDKQGFPIGYGDDHYIDRNVDVQYLIRFQNTGTDTAFTVRITDELSSHFDMSTFHPGASSHNYHININGNEVVYTFENIMLPDSFVNEPGSNGWVEYEISQKFDLPLETPVDNTAAIFFDFNEPVITNTTLHTVGENFLPTSLKHLAVQEESLVFSPNPVQRGQFVLIDTEVIQSLTYQIFNIDGQVMQSGNLNNGKLQIPRQISSGVYLITLTDGEGKTEFGRLVIN